MRVPFPLLAKRLNVVNHPLDKKFRTSAEAKGDGLDPVKYVLAPQSFITNRSKAVLLLWFLYVTCRYVRVYMAFSNMVT